jgi:hypothetical protein
LRATLFGKPFFYLLALIAATAFTYYPGLSGNFLFDDQANILLNPALGLFDGTFSSLLAASANGQASPIGRPLSMASFALNLHFFGAAPFSFKLVNLLIHLANGVLIFILVQQLWPRLAGGKNSALAAVWVTAIWLLHPINLTPVLFVVQRMTSLSAFFSLAALILYLHGRKMGGGKGYALIAAGLLLCWPVAILAKETAILLPLFIFLCEWLALGGLRQLPARARRLVPIIAAVVLVGVLVAQWAFLTAGYRFRDFGLLERLMTEARVLWFYILQLLLPWPDLFALHHDDFPISRGLLSPASTLLALAGWVASLTFAIYRRKQNPLLTFGVLWFIAAHTLESSILPLEIAYEHRNYLASIGIFICLAGLVFAPNAPARVLRDQTTRLALAASFVIFCGLITGLRAQQWGDEFRRTTMEAVTHPNSMRAHHEAALAVLKNTFLSANGGSDLAYQTAQSHFQRAGELDIKSKAPLIGLLYLDCLANQPKNPMLQIQLRERFSTHPFPPGDSLLIHSLSELLVNNRLCLNDAEVDALLKAALGNPMAVGGIRGMIYAVAMDYAAAKIGSPPLALEYARAAVQSNPGSVPLRINLVQLLIGSRDKVAARQEFSGLTTLRIPPVDQSTVDQLGKQLDRLEHDANPR